MADFYISPSGQQYSTKIQNPWGKPKTQLAFAPSSGGRRPMTPSGAQIGKYYKTTAGGNKKLAKFLKEVGDRSKGRQKSMKEMGKAVAYTAANAAAQVVVRKLADKLTGNDKGITAPAGLEPRSVMPTMAENSSRNFYLSNDTETRQIHKTVYTTGFLPSKAVRERTL